MPMTNVTPFSLHLGNRDVLDMVSSDMEQRTVESGTALTFEPKMTRARTKQAFDAGDVGDAM